MDNSYISKIPESQAFQVIGTWCQESRNIGKKSCKTLLYSGIFEHAGYLSETGWGFKEFHSMDTSFCMKNSNARFFTPGTVWCCGIIPGVFSDFYPLGQKILENFPERLRSLCHLSQNGEIFFGDRKLVSASSIQDTRSEYPGITFGLLLLAEADPQSSVGRVHSVIGFQDILPELSTDELEEKIFKALSQFFS